MKRGEVWIASLDPRKGAEVGKQRPVLIVQTDLLNDVGHPTVIVLPISSQDQKESLLRFEIAVEGLHREKGFVLIDQPRSLDAAMRLKKHIGEVSLGEMEQIGRLLKQVLDIA